MRYLSTMIFSLFFSAFCLTAQETETRSLNNFHGVSTSASIDAVVKKGSKNEVVITASGVELDRVSTEIENGVLRLGFKKKSNWTWMKKTKVKAEVTYTGELDYLSASSSGDLICESVVSGDELTVKASSSGDVSVEVDVDNLSASASSSGDIEISGSANEAKLMASSSGDVLGDDLEVNHADVSASSSGDVELTVRESIKARASSGGDITYRGNPKTKDIKRSSGGDVHGK